MKLLFVYNANSGLASAMFDSAHKVFSPSTYDCKLCAITYGLVGPRKEWTTFLKTLDVPTRFLHRDEFQKEFPGVQGVRLPAIFSEKEGARPDLVMSGEELSSIPTLDALIQRVKQLIG